MIDLRRINVQRATCVQMCRALHPFTGAMCSVCPPGHNAISQTLPYARDERRQIERLTPSIVGMKNWVLSSIDICTIQEE